VLELHRNGMLMLMQAHLMSLINVRHLVERKAVRIAAAAEAAAASASAASVAPTPPPAA
jgi:hypothetical protein